MKHTIPLLAVISSICIFCSCTRLVYSTDQYLKTLRTKNEVLMRFGEPTEKNGSEIVYDYGTKPNGERRYVKFTFDAQDSVTSYEYQWVNYSKRKPAPGKTLALVGGLVLLGVIIVAGLISWNEFASSWGN